MGAYDPYIPEREFVGYGAQKPDPKWPNSKIAVNFTVNYNTGAENTPLLGDDFVESYMLELPHPRGSKARFDPAESQYEYGGRHGVARLLALFKKYDLKTTWNISTQAFKEAPFWAKHIIADGHELSCGNARYIDYFDIAPEVEEEQMREAIQTLQAVSGDKTVPKGWLVDRRSNVTQRLYARVHHELDLPLLYSSDGVADDLPYWLPSPLKMDGLKDEGLLIVPFAHDTSDLRFNVLGNGYASPKDFLASLSDAFDILYEEGEEGEPKMMTVLLHPHIVGRGSRCYYLEESVFIKYITSKPNVWIPTREEIARHWRATYPYDPKTAFGQKPAPPVPPSAVGGPSSRVM